MSRQEEIRLALQNAFNTAQLEVTDESEQHRGHAGYQEGGQSHFHVLIRAANVLIISEDPYQRTFHHAVDIDLMPLTLLQGADLVLLRPQHYLSWGFPFVKNF